MKLINVANLVTGAGYFSIAIAFGIEAVKAWRLSIWHERLFAWGAIAIFAASGTESVLSAGGMSSTWLTLFLSVAGLQACLFVILWSKQAKSLINQIINYQRLSTADQFTGLDNRMACCSAIDKQIEGESAFVILFLVLHRLQIINDVYGHGAGDFVLQETAKRLKSRMADKGGVYSFGGNEFVAILPAKLGRGQMEARDLAEDLAVEIEKKISWAGEKIGVAVSIGIACKTYHTSYSQLLSDSRAAASKAYASKRTWSFSGESTQIAARRREELFADIRRGLEAGEFILHYQPIFKVQKEIHWTDWEIAGYECLARWQHPKKGLLYPGEFILAVQESEYMLTFTEWVIGQATQTAVQYSDKYFAINVPPNLSGEDLQAVSHSLNRSLAVEIVEEALNQDDAVMGYLHAIKRSGMSLILDDFGIGYSDLVRSLMKVWDYIKIDRLLKNRSESIKAIVDLIHSCGAKAILEGIEEGDLPILRAFVEAGGDAVQGFLFGRPAPLDEEGKKS